MEIITKHTVTYHLEITEDEKKVLNNFAAILDSLCDEFYKCSLCPLDKACHHPSNVQSSDYVTQIIKALLALENNDT